MKLQMEEILQFIQVQYLIFHFNNILQSMKNLTNIF